MRRVYTVSGLLSLVVASLVVSATQAQAAPRSRDTVPPTAPSSLVASNVTQTSVRLDWGASTDNVGVAYYAIYRTVGGVTAKIDTTLTSLADVISNLSADTLYQFFVKAVDSTNNVSASSPVVAVRTLASAPPPSWTDCSNGYVALTYDDGPNSSSTQTVNTLRQYGVRATFFDVGQNVSSLPNAAVAQYAGGSNSIQNHTWDHASFTGASTGTAPMTSAQITSELTQTANAVVSAGLPRPTMVRPPYGDTNAFVESVISSLGLLEIGWTTDTFDWQNPSAATIAQRVLAAASGGVVLMHDGKPNTVAAIPQIASGLAAQHRCPGKIVYSATPQTVWDGWQFNGVAASW